MLDVADQQNVGSAKCGYKLFYPALLFVLMLNRSLHIVLNSTKYDMYSLFLCNKDKPITFATAFTLNINPGQSQLES